MKSLPGNAPATGDARALSPGLAAVLPDLRLQPLAAIHLVMSIRLCALAEAHDSDALAALACRLGSVTAAKAVSDLAERIGQTWPERFVTARPCCLRMTPDEWTVALMARASRAADRDTFAAALHGFVRTDRHDALYAATTAALAAIDAAG